MTNQTKVTQANQFNAAREAANKWRSQGLPSDYKQAVKQVALIYRGKKVYCNQEQINGTICLAVELI